MRRRVTAGAATAGEPYRDVTVGMRKSACAANEGSPVERQMHQIGEVAEAVGLSLRTIRYYEEADLVPPSGRSAGGFRLYTDDDIDRLRLVKSLKPLDLTIDEMRNLLTVRDRATDRSISRSAASRGRRAAVDVRRPRRPALPAAERAARARSQISAACGPRSTARGPPPSPAADAPGEMGSRSRCAASDPFVRCPTGEIGSPARQKGHRCTRTTTTTRPAHLPPPHRAAGSPVGRPPGVRAHPQRRPPRR